ncbi:MAG: glycerol-3-phosphate 1-O-acyltransferase PlsY [Nitrospiria bacterium]
MAVINYLLGSIPFGLLIAKFGTGIDPRKAGSRNIGATNISRVVGKKAAILTFLCDLIKGIPLIFAAQASGLEEVFVLVIAFSAILGHIFSVFLKFKGGKGVATSFGTFIVLAPIIAFVGLFFWMTGKTLGRYSSVGALTAFASLPFLTLLFKSGSAFFIFSLIVSLLIFFRHRENIQRLKNGTEGTV